tara:strand:- start:359 stop:1120 length:762 start_codon:yes stop_codon:yes gene_type:complete
VDRVLKLVALLLILPCLASCITSSSGSVQPGTVDQVVESRVYAAKKYLVSKDFVAARRHLKKAYELSPNSPDVHDALALMFQYSGEMAMAEQHYQQAIILGDGSSRLRNNYANYLYQENRFDEALSQLQIISQDALYQNRESALLLKGLCQQSLLSFDEAKVSYQKVLLLNGNNRAALRQLSILSFDMQDASSAWAYLQRYKDQVSRLDPELLLLGFNLARTLDLPDAKASYSMTLRNLYPDSESYQRMIMID